MAERVFVHVGTPKSGTTYLQAGLWAQREELRTHGLLYPGRTPFDHNRASILVRQGRHLRRSGKGGKGGGRKRKVWTRFCRQAEAFEGTVVLSNEWYLAAGPEQAAAAVEQLGGDRVHVVVTTRSLVRLVPAGWQESLKVGRGTSLDDFVAGLDDPGNKWSWEVVDPAPVVRQWSEVVGPERVHLITMPETPASPSQLWDRFCRTVGLDADGIEVPPRQANESLSVQAARLLQEFGPALRDEIDRHDSGVRNHSRWLRTAVVRQVLAGLPGDPIGVGPELRDRLAERAEASVAALRESGVCGHRRPRGAAGRHRPRRVTSPRRRHRGRAAGGEPRTRGRAARGPDDQRGGARARPRRPGRLRRRRRRRRGRRLMSETTRRWTFLVPSAYAAGGIARTVFTTASTLVARGHQVRILTLNRVSAEPKFDLDPRVELVAMQDRYDPDQPDRPRRVPRDERPAGEVRELLGRKSDLVSEGQARKTFNAYVDDRLRHHLSAAPAGVVVTTRPEFAVAASRWAAPGSVLLHQEHLSFVPRPEPLRAALRDLALGAGGVRPIDALLALTEADLERWRAYVGDDRVRTDVIPNPTPFEVGEPAPLTTPTVIAAGRLTSQKGFERLVEAWVPLATSHPDWQLRIFGDGPHDERLHAQVADAGVGDRILLGGVTRELERELADSSVYAMSSRFEGLPMVLLEALSKGVPPVSYDIPEGPRQLIDHGRNGLLVPEGDIAGLTDALRTLMDDPDLRRRLGAEALETARSYEAGAIADRWVALAEEVLAERG